ncbi:secreted protein, partial [methanotrophic bacterial endosymbiont of Bathymodiolus sp.]
MKIKLIPILFLGLFAAQVANADALGDQIRADIMREMAENHARDLDGIPNEEKDGSLEDWIKTEATFNYKLPCDIDKTIAVAVVVHGVNRMDLL